VFIPETRVINGGREINQYCVSLCGELAGKIYFLRFDDGMDFFIQFLDERFLLLGSPGASPTLEGYCCMKSDDLTYFVHIDRTNATYAPITLALDLENRLVTRVDTGKGSPDLPRWFTMKPCFGYIGMCGFQAPVERHELSRDLIGSKIEWHYNEREPITHMYMQNNTVRLGRVPFEELSPERREFYLKRKELGLEPFEEPVQFIRIKTYKYLVCFCECNMAHVNPTVGGGGILLMDLSKVTDVGIFFTIKDNKEGYNPVSAYGRFSEKVFSEETAPSCYKVRYGMDGKQVYPPLK